MWPDNRLCDLLGVEIPIIQAPMLGTSTPQLAAAVCNAGGFGTLACGELPGDQVREISAQMAALTDRPFGMNFFVRRQEPPAPPEALAEIRDRLRPFYAELGLGEPPEPPPQPPPGFGPETCALLCDLRPRAVSFHFGAPEPACVVALKSAGIVLMSSATNTAEARALEAAGMDMIIAQGWEAGGHRGSHEPNAPGDGIGTFALLPQVADAVRLPVIAAGGVGDARGIAAAFALGASGVQIGTGFLACPEAATDATRRDLLARASDRDTVVTAAVSGRCARAVRSRYSDAMLGLDRLLPFPSMYGLSGPMLEAAGKTRSDAVSFHLYGQAAALNRSLPAAELVARLAVETLALLRELGSGPDAR